MKGAWTRTDLFNKSLVVSCLCDFPLNEQVVNFLVTFQLVVLPLQSFFQLPQLLSLLGVVVQRLRDADVLLVHRLGRLVKISGANKNKNIEIGKGPIRWWWEMWILAYKIPKKLTFLPMGCACLNLLAKRYRLDLHRIEWSDAGIHITSVQVRNRCFEKSKHEFKTGNP